MQPAHDLRSATESIEPSLLVSPLHRGHTSIYLSRPLFTYTNTYQAATYTCNIRPRVSHTILSITYHTKDRPSTGPRMLMFSPDVMPLQYFDIFIVEDEPERQA
jgi:hypothetical protein